MNKFREYNLRLLRFIKMCRPLVWVVNSCDTSVPLPSEPEVTILHLQISLHSSGWVLMPISILLYLKSNCCFVWFPPVDFHNSVSFQPCAVCCFYVWCTKIRRESEVKHVRAGKCFFSDVWCMLCEQHIEIQFSQNPKPRRQGGSYWECCVCCNTSIVYCRIRKGRSAVRRGWWRIKLLSAMNELNPVCLRARCVSWIIAVLL